MPLEMRCKYDATHGTFGSPKALTIHYQTDHADVHTTTAKPRVVCRYCGHRLATSSVGHHMRQQHGITDTHRHADHLADEGAPPPSAPMVRHLYRCNVCSKETTANNIGAHMRAHGITEWRDHVTDAGQREVAHRGKSGKTTKRRCTVCGTVTRADNMTRHFNTQHNGMAWSINSEEVGDTPTTAMVAAHTKAKAVTDVHALHTDNTPWHTDDIVMPVVQQLAGGPNGVIPVANLAAILVWRDQTAVMLANVAARPWQR